MKTLARLLSMICVPAALCVPLSAQEMLVFPPAGLPEETWYMSYKDYNVYSNITTMRAKGGMRKVTFVWDDKTLYVKGIFEDYPDSWIKATLHGKEVVFDNAQLICELDTRLENPRPIYAMTGIEEYKYTEYNEYMFWYEYSIQFHLNGSDINGTRSWASFKLIDYDTRITSKVEYPLLSNLRTAFWTDTEPYGIYFLYYNNVTDGIIIGDGFPDVDIPTAIQFKKSGDVNSIGDAEDPHDDTTYDIYGRQVNPEHLAPGIYIRNGEKFIVR